MLKISQNCKKNPAVFSMVMAHELSHLLLYSLRHPEKNNEFYTDLLAMMLGFQNIFKKGHKIRGIIKSITYGYFTDEQFVFALKKINLLLKENKKKKKLLLKKFKKVSKSVLKYEKKLFEFKKFLEYLTKNINKKILQEDDKKIGVFFQPEYMDELELFLQECKEKLKTIQSFLKEISHYTPQKVNQLAIYINELKTYTKNLKFKVFCLQQNVKILKKYC